MQILVPMASGLEEIEAVTIVDVLRRADLEVIAAGCEEGPVRGSRGVVLLPDELMDAWLERTPAAIVLPGGAEGARRLAADARVRSVIQRVLAGGGVVGAICAGPLVLASMGLLDGRPCTCHPSVSEQMGAANVREDRVWVDGDIITGKGPGASLDFALAVVERLCGAEVAQQVASPMYAD